MKGRRLILNDGTVIEDGEAGAADGVLWCWIRGYTMSETAAIFLDGEKTAVIVFQYGEAEDRYDGYTECLRLMDDGGRVSVCLAKEVKE